ncbi:hypothetical protein [Roseococcus pinisoli]|uniref:Uncharacterized protein n=1 Tax=Roseococcus pinisoli TaxID=2835040 RepID=A0ABS5QA20_9PROT|nr:hypothetical protein [Roseococcus pinisoli]MBS7810552.1 hypothetical protein [Roseococcus pinisoli]
MSDRTQSLNDIETPMKVTNILTGMAQAKYIEIDQARGAHIYNAEELEKTANSFAYPSFATQMSNREKVKEFITSINDYNRKSHGNKGPVDTARNLTTPDFILLVLSCGYNLNEFSILKKVANFIMTLATVDFEGRNTTGTQMGNFQGSWRGGGFG